MSVDFKVLLFLGGIMSGLLLSLLLILPYKNKVVELDLNKIITTYAAITAKAHQEVATVNQDFKVKFNKAMQQIPSQTIVVSKGHLLSQHKLTDYTEKFLQTMEINKTHDQIPK